MCMPAQVPETMGSRAQEDFLVACRTIDPEYGTSGLRALIDLKDAGTSIPLVKDYSVSLLLTSSVCDHYLQDSTLWQQQQQQKKKRDGNKAKFQCPCGLKHYWIECWLINTEHPRRPTAYSNAIG
jgi:hypothetical protein